MKIIELPIKHDDHAHPWKPDFKRLWKMWIYLFVIMFFSIAVIYTSNYFAVQNISIADEQKFLWEIFEAETEFSLDVLKNTPDIPYKIYLVDESEDEGPNAFALPGAIIYITPSLLRSITTQEELIFILGHEVAHIESRDSLRAFIRYIPLLMTLNYIWLDAGISLSTMNNLALNILNQSTEEDADIWGITLINSMELNTQCAIWFFDENIDEESLIPDFMSSHPTDISRREQLLEKNQYKTPCHPFVWEAEKVLEL